ncbi:hypothetical protein ACSQ67_025914 [Phaseolus vulgaris]
MIVMRKVSVREGTKQGDTHEFVREVGSGGVVETVVGARVMEEGMLVHVTGGTSGFCSTPSFIFVAPLSHLMAVKRKTKADHGSLPFTFDLTR